METKLFLLEIAKQTRLNFVKLMDSLTIEQLNYITKGYKNNIAWNFAHIVAAQQTLCYVQGNIVTRIPLDRVTKYQKGSIPEGFISTEELNFYKTNAFSLLDHLKDDMNNGRFCNYEQIATLFGVTLADVNEALAYFVTHDNLHFGYALSLLRAVLESPYAK